MTKQLQIFISGQNNPKAVTDISFKTGESGANHVLASPSSLKRKSEAKSIVL